MYYKLFLIIIGLFLGSVVNAQKAVYPFKQDRKWGIVNEDGKVIFEPKSGYLMYFFFNHTTKYAVSKVKKYDKYVLIDRYGNELLEEKYTGIFPSNSPKIIFLENANGVQVYNVELKKIILENLNNDFGTSIKVVKEAIVYTRDNEIVTYDFKGRRTSNAPKQDDSVIAELVFKEQNDCDGKRDRYQEALKKKSKDWGAVLFLSGCEPWFVSVSNGEKLALFNSDVSNLTGFEFDKIEPFGDDKFILTKGEMNGLYDGHNEKMLLPVTYKKIQSAFKAHTYYQPEKYIQEFVLYEYALVRKTDTWYYFNLYSGQEYIPKMKK